MPGGRRVAARRAGGAEAQELVDLGLVGQLGLGEFSGNPPALQHQNPIRQIGDEVEILLDQKDRQTAPFAQMQQGFRHLLDDRGLDSLRRLVQQQEFRIAHQASGQGQQLLLAARQRATHPVEQPRQPREIGEHGFDYLFLAAA